MQGESLSVETILIIAIFIVAPLIQSLVGALRKSAERKKVPDRASADVRAKAAQQRQVPRPEVPLDVPDVSTTIPSDATAARQALRDSIAMLELKGLRETAVLPVLPRPNTRRGRRGRSRFMAEIRDPGALRRAMVLTAVLGPCRALNPPD